MGEWKYSFTVLDLGTRSRRAVSFMPQHAFSLGKEPPVPIGEETGWASEQVWTLEKKKISYPYWELNPCHPAAHCID
jgi:hypothetical protein